MLRINTRRIVCASLFAASLASTQAATAKSTPLSPELAAKVKAETPPPGPVETFAGKVPGSKAYLAVVSRGGQIEAYLCDSATAASWLSGKLASGKLTAANKAGNVTLTGTRAGTSLKVTLTSKGTAQSINLTRVAAPAGVYEAIGVNTSGDFIRAGWIVLPDGTQRGNRLVAGAVQPVVALNPSVISVDIGAPVLTVAAPAGVTTFKATPTGVQSTTTLPVTTEKSLCDKLKDQFDMQKGNWDFENAKEHPDERVLSAFGNAFTQTYQQAKANNCSWVATAF